MAQTRNGKRKRTYTDDEDLENNPPPVCLEAAEEDVWADELLTPDSDCLNSSVEPSSEASSHMESEEQLDHKELRLGKTLSTCRNTIPLTPRPERLGPLPDLSFADRQEVWDLMCEKNEDSLSLRHENMFSRHPQIQPRMRSILLDWIIEVCEVYKLHRETYHLALDFIDRYLSVRKDIPKGHLQLIGITCLFLAAKTEEIYPPKLAEFSYVTDGACTDHEILEKEILILQALKWRLSTVTVNGWLTMYSQLCSNGKLEGADDTFVFPQFSGLNFIQTAQLVDLITLDESSLRFSYSVLAASALWHMAGHELALAVSGLSREELEECVSWTLPFAQIIEEEGSIRLPNIGNSGNSGNAISSGLLKFVPKIVVDNSHNIQTHIIDLEMLDRVRERRLELEPVAVDSALEFSSPSDPGLLTPPASHKKQGKHHTVVTGWLT